MATTNSIAATVVTEEDLQDLEELERDLQERAGQARANGRAFMMAQYVDLIATVQPQITRIRNRFKRERLAALRKEQKSLKANGQAPEGVA